MPNKIGRIALAVLVTLALGVGLTAFAGPANALRSASAASACASQQGQVAKFQHKVARDKKKLKSAKRHHHKAASKKARKHLKRDRKKLAAAKRAYNACLQSQSSGTPAPSPAPAPAPSNPVTEQCNAAAGQLAAQDPSGQFATGAAAFCDLLGQLAASTGGDPTALCGQLAAQDPSGQFAQLCTALGGSSLPGVPAPGTDPVGGPVGGTVGGTLEDACNQIAAQDPSGQMSQLCTGLGSLPI